MFKSSLLSFSFKPFDRLLLRDKQGNIRSQTYLSGMSVYCLRSAYFVFCVNVNMHVFIQTSENNPHNLQLYEVYKMAKKLYDNFTCFTDESQFGINFKHTKTCMFSKMVKMQMCLRRPRPLPFPPPPLKFVCATNLHESQHV